jgi:hypothetical protein
MSVEESACANHNTGSSIGRHASILQLAYIHGSWKFWMILTHFVPVKCNVCAELFIGSRFKVFFFFPWLYSPALSMASSKKSSWISWRLLNNFLFYGVGLLAPRPTPIPKDHASVFISHRGRMATHFSRLLRHAWITVYLMRYLKKIVRNLKT